MSGEMSDEDSMLLSRPPEVQPMRLTLAFVTMVSLMFVGFCVVSVWVTPSEVKRHVVDMQLEKKFTIKNSHVAQAADGDINNDQRSSHIKEKAEGDIINKDYRTINEFPDSKVINMMKKSHLVVTVTRTSGHEIGYAGTFWSKAYNCTLTAAPQMWTKLGFHNVHDYNYNMGNVGTTLYSYDVDTSVVQAFNVDLKSFSVLNVTLSVYGSPNDIDWKGNYLEGPDENIVDEKGNPLKHDDNFPYAVWHASHDFLFVAGMAAKDVAEASNITTSPECLQQSTLCMPVGNFGCPKFKAKHVAVRISAMPKRCNGAPGVLCTVVSVPLKDLQGFSVFRIWVNGTYGLLKGTMEKGGFCPGCVEKHYYEYVSAGLG